MYLGPRQLPTQNRWQAWTLTGLSNQANAVLVRSGPGPLEIVLEDLVLTGPLTGPSLHSGLAAPPTASQAFVPGEASEA